MRRKNPLPFAAIGEVVGTGLGTGAGFATGFTLLNRLLNGGNSPLKKKNPIRGKVEVSHVDIPVSEIVGRLRGAGYEFLTNYDTVDQALSRAKVLERDGYDVKITPVELPFKKVEGPGRPWWVLTRKAGLYRSNPASEFDYVKKDFICSDCGKEFKMTGRDEFFDRRAGLKPLCKVCRNKPGYNRPIGRKQ